MNCENVQSLLLTYLDGEVTPSERALLLAHLSSCTVCQQELDLLSTARSQVRTVLQRRASQAVPSRDAWNRLEVRLTEAAQPSSKFSAWFSRKAPNASHASNRNKILGGVPMQKRSILTAAATVFVIAVLALFVARNAIPVSAGQILDRAYQAQTQAPPTQGIEHIRSEMYSNLEAKSEDQALETIVESYSDPVSGNFRVVTTDKESGKVLRVDAFDGSNLYTSDNLQDGQQSAESLTVYRSPQDRASLFLKKFANGTDRKLNPALDADAKTMFDKMRHDPAVELLGQETWDNGHTVYVLRSQQEIKLMVENELTHPMGWVTVYFDTETYQLLGNRVSMEKDGKEVLISLQQTMLDELLPADSNIAWDLSDLQGLNMVDDPNHEHNIPGVIAPTVISLEIWLQRPILPTCSRRSRLVFP